ncbi:MAG TPA: hypothetical protein VK766_07110 [Cytophagaceae bacterium]|nr:hypothetical protein [Cytophagaceae bacterium]
MSNLEKNTHLMTNLELLKEEQKKPQPVDPDTQALERNIKALKRLNLEILNQNPLLTQDPDLPKAVNQLIQISTLEKLMVIAKEIVQEIENQPSEQNHLLPALEKLLMIAKELTVEKISQNEEIGKLQKSLRKKEEKKDPSEKILKAPKAKVSVKIKLPKDIKDDQQLLLLF